MIRYLLLAFYSILFTLYIGVIGGFTVDFLSQILYVVGAFLIALSAGLYLLSKVKTGTLLGLIGVGLVSARVFIPWLMLPFILNQDIRYLLFLLPGLGTLLIYYILIKTYINNNWDGLEFISIATNEKSKIYLFGAPLLVNVLIIMFFVFR